MSSQTLLSDASSPRSLKARLSDMVSDVKHEAGAAKHKVAEALPALPHVPEVATPVKRGTGGWFRLNLLQEMRRQDDPTYDPPGPRMSRVSERLLLRVLFYFFSISAAVFLILALVFQLGIGRASQAAIWAISATCLGCALAINTRILKVQPNRCVGVAGLIITVTSFAAFILFCIGASNDDLDKVGMGLGIFVTLFGTIAAGLWTLNLWFPATMTRQVRMRLGRQGSRSNSVSGEMKTIGSFEFASKQTVEGTLAHLEKGTPPGVVRLHMVFNVFTVFLWYAMAVLLIFFTFDISGNVGDAAKYSPPPDDRVPVINTTYPDEPGNDWNVTVSPTMEPTSPPPTYGPTGLGGTYLPTFSPTFMPTDGPSFAPTMSPSTSEPTPSPTFSSPTDSPTFSEPTTSPSLAPTTSEPTVSPTTSGPSAGPTNKPSTSPSAAPTTSVPTFSPSRAPFTSKPSVAPSGSPSASPSTSRPSQTPSTSTPTLSPSETATNAPTSQKPSANPTTRPSKTPSLSPITSAPTTSPSATPTMSSPTKSPTSSKPSQHPTHIPSKSPTTSSPSFSPTVSAPTRSPTPQPTTRSPTSRSPTPAPPTKQPSLSPSEAPTSSPTRDFVPVPDPPPPAFPPGIVLVNGHVHFLCAGNKAARPPIILDHDVGTTLDVWASVQSKLVANNNTYVCSYSRRGYGYSSPGNHPRTVALTAVELKSAMDSLNLTSPVLLVGHGWAGFNLQRFYHLFPERAAGLIFLDTYSTQCYRAPSCSASVSKPDTERYEYLESIIPFGFIRALAYMGISYPGPAGVCVPHLPNSWGYHVQDARNRFLAALLSPSHWNAARAEDVDSPTSCALAAQAPGNSKNNRIKVPVVSIYAEHGLLKSYGNCAKEIKNLGGGTQVGKKSVAFTVAHMVRDTDHFSILYGEGSTSVASLILDTVQQIRIKSKLYYKFPEAGRKSWSAARAYCESNGMRMATVLDKVNQDDIDDLKLSHDEDSFWLGATDSAQHGVWRWTSNELVMGSSGYTNWHPGEPNKASGNDCMQIQRSNTKWRAKPCSQLQFVLCEKDAY